MSNIITFFVKLTGFITIIIIYLLLPLAFNWLRNQITA